MPQLPLFPRMIGTAVLALAVGALSLPASKADEPASETPVPAETKRPLSKDPPGMKRLMPQYDVWVDPKNKRVVADGSVVLREGQLEMFACPKGTKEHESVVAVDAQAYVIHAGLLAVGAEAGTPVAFQPEYKPATGPEVDVEVVWRDAQGTVHNDKAQNWVRDAKTGKAMESPWVFGGSGFWTDDVTGKKYYLAESGDLICVSNFPSAMLDLPVQSSQDNEQLLYEAFTERIPPIGTRVRLVLTPKAKKDDKAEATK
jgi:hypothetical protein